MLLLLCAAALCFLCFAGLRRDLPDGVQIELQGFDGGGVLAAFAVTCAAAMVVGPLNGLALLAALVLHEVGHWLALRLIGYKASVLRFLPMPDAEAPAFARDIDRLFHALMGSGIAVAPMVLAVALAPVASPPWAGFFRALALSLCLVGCVSLLPFRFCDGGTVIRTVARAMSPSVPYLAGATGIAGLILFGIATGLVWSYAVAALGLLGLILRPAPSAGIPLDARQARLGFLAWAAIFGAHFAAGVAALAG